MSAKPARKKPRECALVLAGGVALGAYQGGVYAALHEKGLAPTWISASSIGSINAALIVGTPPEERVRALKEFWGVRAMGPLFAGDDVAGPFDAFRHLRCWGSVLQARIMGVPGHFMPRVLQPPEGFASFYDLDPLRSRIERLVDFDLLNSGRVRLSVMTTDLESGEGVLFDTAKNDKIRADHLLASCGLPPEFAPVEIGGRVLGDGGLWANAPIEPVLQGLAGGLCILVDLFSRPGGRPTSIESALARKIELMFANQTWHQLEAQRRELALRAQIAALHALLPKAKRDPDLAAEAKRKPPEILHVAYRAPNWEAGPERPFDYSPETAASRWAAGHDDMMRALGGAD